MIRTALWLIQCVGLGNTFTKEQHRKAFVGVAQADRRLRDLRKHGWVIHTSSEDVTLKSSEQRFVASGKPVWQRGVLQHEQMPSAKVRRTILADNDYQCVVCGIAGGERYLDSSETVAVLGISKRRYRLPDGRTDTLLVPECKRCRAGAVTKAVDVAQLLVQLKALDAASASVFLQWANDGRRQPLDRLWADFRQLPLSARKELVTLLRQKSEAVGKE